MSKKLHYDHTNVANLFPQVRGAVHKMIPSFLIVGFNANFEKIARQIQKYANCQQSACEINDLVSPLKTACEQACLELKEELERIKSTKMQRPIL